MLEEKILTFNKYAKEKFGNRVARISFDVGEPCPWNRCIFCNHDSFIPFGCVPIFKNDWLKKYEKVRNFMCRRYKADLFFAYFQSNTSTCIKPEMLNKYVKEALDRDEMMGVSVSTRPDYLEQEHVEALLDGAGDKEIWIELGLQSMSDTSLEWIKRGHSASRYLEAVEMIAQVCRGRISVAPHMIIGIPEETPEEMIRGAQKATEPDCVRGIKFHHLQIHKNTELHALYEKEPFPLMTVEHYIDIMSRLVCSLDNNLIFLRLFTTSPSDYLVAPRWNLTTQELLLQFDAALEKNNMWQGKWRKT